MTDQTIPDLPQGPYTLDDVWLARDWASHILKTPGSSIPMERSAARVLQALLPPPSRPTLADMTPEERRECQWMQADVEHRGRAVVIVPEWGAGHAELLSRRGSVFYAAHDSVTPRPDLPRMTWPGDKKPAPALPEGWRLADHPDHGRVIVTTENQDRDGYVGFVHRADFINSGHGNDWCKPEELTYIDQEADQ